MPVPPRCGLGKDGWPVQAALAGDTRPAARIACRNQRRKKAEPTEADAAAGYARAELHTLDHRARLVRAPYRLLRIIHTVETVRTSTRRHAKHARGADSDAPLGSS